MDTKYTANSLGDIAALFVDMAEKARSHARFSKAHARNGLAVEAYTWMAAAKIIANTTIVESKDG